MISKGLFQTQLNECERILKQFNLLDERSTLPPSYSEVGASFFRKMNYSETWLWCCQNNFFDFLLIDGAVLQFKYSKMPTLELSYAYFEAPYLPQLTFDDFILENDLQDEDNDDEVLRLYEYYTADPPKKECITPVRYDYAPGQYTSGRHPASHIHFGHNSSVRIGTKKLLRPLSFLFFILRQYYPTSWSSFLVSGDSEILCKNVRENLIDIDRRFWSDLDSYEMSLV